MRDACRTGTAGVGIVRQRRSIAVNLEDRFGKGLRGFLRQIVPDAARDDPMRIFARELLGIRTGVRVRRPIGIPFQGNGGHSNDRSFGQPLFEIVILRLAFRQAEPPAVIMDHNADMIRIVEGRRGTLERGLIEGPLRRGELPDELGKVAPVLLVASLSALGGEIKLVPPCELGLGRQRQLPDQQPGAAARAPSA